jgi:tubulin-specific chaperone A
MAPPSKLAIATGVVLRLVKEEASYHKEITQQEARIKKAETSEGDENAEYTLRQEVCSGYVARSLGLTILQRQALQETKNVLPGMKTKIEQAVERLEEELVSSISTMCERSRLTSTQESNKDGEAPEEAVTKAKDAVEKGKAAMCEAS